MRLFKNTLTEEIYKGALELISNNIESIKKSYKEDIEKWLIEYNAENLESSNIVQ